MMDYAYAWQKSPLAPVSRTDAGPLASKQNHYYDYEGLERFVSFKRQGMQDLRELEWEEMEEGRQEEEVEVLYISVHDS